MVLIMNRLNGVLTKMVLILKVSEVVLAGGDGKGGRQMRLGGAMIKM